MKQVWAPWRIEYILGPKEDGCFLCRMFAGVDDRSTRLLHRGKTCAVVMNRYPYTGGHLMVAPYRHVDGLDGMTPVERSEMMELSNFSVEVLKKVMKPQAFNIGINLGAAAGAGLKDHVHLHVVPRWIGDTNFMPALGQTTVVPQALDELYDALKPHFG